MTISKIIAWIKLGRYLFLGGGFVFFALGTAIANSHGVEIDLSRYVVGQLVVTATQLMVQYSNDYFDYEADVVNQTPTRWSGGSRILPSGQLSPKVGLYTAFGLALIAFGAGLYLAAVKDVSTLTIGLLVAAFGLSWSYSAPPMRLHSRGLGEITVAIVVPVLTPLVAYSIFKGDLHSELILTAIPLALLQFNMLLTVHLPDMEGDAVVGKRTLVVILGRERTCHLYQAILVTAYVLIPVMVVAGLPVAVGLGMGLPLPLAIWLFMRMRRGQGLMAEHWDHLAFWTIGLLMATGVLATLGFIVR